MRRRGFTAVLLCLVVTGLCLFHKAWLPPQYDPTQPLDLKNSWTFMTPFKLRILANSDSFCRASLRTSSLHLQPHNHTGTKNCPLTDVVTVSDPAIILEPRSFLASCNLAVRWDLFEALIAKPVTREIFGMDLRGITHLGSFACRDVRNRPGAQSSHATADAIDVSGFILADGQEISVGAWNKPGPNGHYLHILKKRACEVFGTVLSPDYDSLHANHFHFQATGFGLCQ